jgi:hypothetical protein
MRVAESINFHHFSCIAQQILVSGRVRVLVKKAHSRQQEKDGDSHGAYHIQRWAPTFAYLDAMLLIRLFLTKVLGMTYVGISLPLISETGMSAPQNSGIISISPGKNSNAVQYISTGQPRHIRTQVALTP